MLRTCPMLRSSVLVALLVATLPLHARQSPEAPPRQAAIASANAYATDAGLEVLAAGGNAFDAAVAVSATLGLVEPESSGIGGGGLMLLHIAGEGQAGEERQVFIDARERAPGAAHADMYLDANGKVQENLSTDGPLAAAIPGLPAGLVHLSQKYGKLPLKDSLAPAIRLARNGWTMNHKTAALLPWRGDVLKLSPGAMELFFRNGKPVKAGETLKNPAYARTLELLAKHGHDGFYRGELAKKLVRGVQRAGGIWSEEDLAQYKIVEREPLRFTHRGYTLVTAPPVSSGGIALAEIFNMLDGYDYANFERADRLHVTIEAMRRAYRDRAEYLGDPDFTQVPVRLLMSQEYAAGLRATIHPRKATPSELLPPIEAPPARTDTTHFSVIDTEGNLAAITQTVNLTFGNAFAVPGTGFVLNDEMDDFSAAPGVPNAFGLVGGTANAIEPGKRPLSSMTPTLLFGQDRVAAIGTPGGSRIITMVLLGLEALMEGKSAQAAADAPRYHHQYLPDMVFAEPSALTEEQIAALQARGHKVKVLNDTWGNMNIVLWNRLTGEVEAASDGRNEGVGKGALSAPAAIYR